MPQLVKGGKYIFGWSHVSDSGRIPIPDEARIEYGFRPFEKIVIINGSRTSRGFAITKIDLIRKSPIFNNISKYKELIHFQELPDGYIQHGNKIFTWSEVDKHGYFTINEKTLRRYGVLLNDNLVVGRGSRFALAFIKTGHIVKEALMHPELITYR